MACAYVLFVEFGYLLAQRAWPLAAQAATNLETMSQWLRESLDAH
jgi:hypothetical protein